MAATRANAGYGHTIVFLTYRQTFRAFLIFVLSNQRSVCVQQRQWFSTSHFAPREHFTRSADTLGCHIWRQSACGQAPSGGGGQESLLTSLYNKLPQQPFTQGSGDYAEGGG